MNLGERFRQTIHKYRHAWVFLYTFIYVPWFLYLEHRQGVRYYIIHSPLDDYIPFIEYFIVPYLLWFAFIVVTSLYFFFTDRAGFYRLAAFLVIGMTAFLVICTVFPNGVRLRPIIFERDNIFVDMVRVLYATDTPTNVLPSIHVYNSLGMVIAIAHSQELKKYRRVRYGAYVTAAFIILSTVFLKQHSVTDVIAAFTMACVIYPFVYAVETKKAAKLSHQPI